MEVIWKTENGKRYLNVDFRGAKNDVDLADITNKMLDAIKKETGKCLVFANFTDVYLTTKFMSSVNKGGLEVKDKISKNALVGIGGVKRILMKGFMAVTGITNVKEFNDEASALAWLFE